MTKTISLAFLIVALNSCISSLHPLATADKVIQDKSFIGKWLHDSTSFTVEDLLRSKFYEGMTTTIVNQHKTNSGFESPQDSMLYSKSYVVSFKKSNYDYLIICSLMRIGDDLYADFLPVSASFPAASPNTSIFDGTDYLPSHSFAKIIFHERAMELKFLNGDFIKRQLNGGMMDVQYETDPLFNTSVITAPSQVLQQFLGKYGKDARLYSDANTINFRKL